ncbi:MAG: lysophospholipid acyltransferase family protein [Bryobacterales bacterium]|nr:lysophospholipid acyltransferase family protein [Bryobacterales bacterium]
MRKQHDVGAWFVCLIVRSVFWGIGHLPDSLGLFLARRLFRLIDALIPRWRRIALRNLQLALPDLSAEARVKIVSEVYVSLARMVWVVAKLSCIGFDNVRNYLTIESLGYVDEALAQNQGLLFATGHLGAWELSALAFGELVRPMDVIARPLDNRFLDRWVTSLREQTGNRILEKSGNLREMLRALAANRAIGVLLDHNVISKDLCFVDFFGIRTSASTVFAKIAARSGAAVIPGFAVWSEADRRFTLRFEKPVPITGDALADTQAVHSAIEKVIRRHPEQWLWIHRRFKTRPPGEAPLYDGI